jgi:hypothetical protein
LIDDELVTEFWSRVFKRVDGHWIWTGPIDGDCRGIFIFRKKRYKAQRLSLSLKIGRMLERDELACHSRDCLYMTCINPDHLYVGTEWSNAKDREYFQKLGLQMQVQP